MYLKFLNDDNYYEISYEPILIDEKIIIIDETNFLPQKEGGFQIYNENYTLINDYSNYKYFYNKENEYLTFTSDDNIYFVYLLTDSNNVINLTLVTTEEQNENNSAHFLKSGRTIDCKEYTLDIIDKNNIYKYKYLDGEIIELTNEEKVPYFYEQEYLKFIEAKQRKIEQLSSICEKNIVKGIQFNNKNFSYELTDQNNLYNAFQLSQGTGLSVPYHADNEDCELYSQEDIVAIYILQQTNLTHNSTYFNQLKMYVESLNTIEEINAVYYGQELTGTYLEKYNEIMSQAQIITSAFINNN